MNKINVINSLKTAIKILKKQKFYGSLLDEFSEEDVKTFLIKNKIDECITNIKLSALYLFKKLDDFIYSSNSILQEYEVFASLKGPILEAYKNYNYLGDYSLDEISIIAQFNCLMTMFLCTYVIETSSKISELTSDDFKVDGHPIYFRGHNDVRYPLLPSFYRNLVCRDNPITYETVIEKYKEFGFLDKYRKVFPNNVNDFNMLSYIQHCVSYSPLLDVTKSLDIATIFACNGKGINPNDYENNDAAIFVFIDWDNKKHNVSCLRINRIRNSLKFDSKIIINNNDEKYLFECSDDDFEIEYSFNDEATNDRMKYQQGAFLFINKATIIKNHILIPLSQMTIIKIIIPRFKKQQLYKQKIEKQPGYEVEKLLNPYQIFFEYYK